MERNLVQETVTATLVSSTTKRHTLLDTVTNILGSSCPRIQLFLSPRGFCVVLPMLYMAVLYRCLPGIYSVLPKYIISRWDGIIHLILVEVGHSSLRRPGALPLSELTPWTCNMLKQCTEWM